MTKLKSKKMSKSTFAVIIMAVLMVAMLAFGGTYAYFTANTGVMINDSTNLGTIKLTTNDAFSVSSELKENILPSETLVDVTGTNLVVTDNSNRASYIFFQYSVNVYPHAETWNAIRKDATVTAGEDGFAETALTTDVAEIAATLKAEDVTVGVVSGITPEDLDGENGVVFVLTTDSATNGTYTIALSDVKIPDGWGNEYQKARVEVKLEVKSIQAEGMTDEADAWNKLK